MIITIFILKLTLVNGQPYSQLGPCPKLRITIFILTLTRVNDQPNPCTGLTKSMVDYSTWSMTLALPRVDPLVGFKNYNDNHFYFYVDTNQHKTTLV